MEIALSYVSEEDVTAAVGGLLSTLTDRPEKDWRCYAVAAAAIPDPLP